METGSRRDACLKDELGDHYLLVEPRSLPAQPFQPSTCAWRSFGLAWMNFTPCRCSRTPVFAAVNVKMRYDPRRHVLLVLKNCLGIA